MCTYNTYLRPLKYFTIALGVATPGWKPLLSSFMCLKMLPHGNFNVVYNTLQRWSESHIQTASVTLCAICRRFKADRRPLLPRKRNPEAVAQPRILFWRDQSMTSSITDVVLSSTVSSVYFLTQCGPSYRPAGRMWPADTFRKNLQVWNLLKNM